MPAGLEQIFAQSDFLLAFPDGTERTVQLRVGKPYKIDDGEWACPCDLAGFEPRYPDIRGVDSLQALCLALSMMRRRLEDFLEKGGRISPAGEGDDRVKDGAGYLAALFGGMSQGPVQ